MMSGTQVFITVVQKRPLLGWQKISGSLQKSGFSGANNHAAVPFTASTCLNAFDSLFFSLPWKRISLNALHPEFHRIGQEKA